MKYFERIDKLLSPSSELNHLVLDLFAGCGGLALGFEAKGFKTQGFEMDKDCCDTYEKNLLGQCENVILTTKSSFPKASVIIGGPPCQPFSVGGKQLGIKDSRDGFPIFIEAIRQVNPEIWLFENVRGLFYRNRWYLDEIIDELKSLNYIVELPRLLNASSYAVPQNRERVIVVGHRGRFYLPKEIKPKVTAGEALDDLIFQENENGKFLTPSQDVYIAKYEKASYCVKPRDLILDLPARTLTCRNLAGATGDMMRVRLADGRRRRLTVKEAARLQSFPDWFEFVGGENSIYYQIGNAVPPMFAYYLAGSIANYLISKERFSEKEIKTFNKRTLIDLMKKEEQLDGWNTKLF